MLEPSLGLANDYISLLDLCKLRLLNLTVFFVLNLCSHHVNGGKSPVIWLLLLST